MQRTKGENALSDSRSELKLNYDDYLSFPDDGKRREILDGELFVTPAPNTQHQAVVLNLATALKVFLDQSPLGRVFVAPTDVVLSSIDVVEPDVLFIASNRLERLTKANIQGAPDLAVEVLSPTTRRTDEVVKRKRYEQFDVREYWIVDPELETVKVYRRGDSNAFERVAELAKESGDTLTTPLLPGFAIRLARIFE